MPRVSFFSTPSPLTDPLSYKRATDQIFNSLQTLQVAEAFDLFCKYKLPFNTLIDEQYSDHPSFTALHVIIFCRDFDCLRAFLWLIYDLPDGAHHLKEILTAYPREPSHIRLPNYAMQFFLKERQATGKDHPQVKKLAAMVQFLVEITGEKVTCGKLFSALSPAEQAERLLECQHAYKEKYSQARRARWEERLGGCIKAKRAAMVPCR